MEIVQGDFLVLLDPLVPGVRPHGRVTVRIEVVDKPLVVAFFAHWCPHCQREVDELTTWMVDNDLPANVDFAADREIARCRDRRRARAGEPARYARIARAGDRRR